MLDIEFLKLLSADLVRVIVAVLVIERIARIVISIWKARTGVAHKQAETENERKLVAVKVEESVARSIAQYRATIAELDQRVTLLQAENRTRIAREEEVQCQLTNVRRSLEADEKIIATQKKELDSLREIIEKQSKRIMDLEVQVSLWKSLALKAGVKLEDLTIE